MVAYKITGRPDKCLSGVTFVECMYNGISAFQQITIFLSVENISSVRIQSQWKQVNCLGTMAAFTMAAFTTYLSAKL